MWLPLIFSAFITSSSELSKALFINPNGRAGIAFYKNCADTLNKEIFERVKKIIIATLGVSEAEVIPGASFTNDLGADSLDTVELILEFEKEFNVSIPDEECEKATTVEKAVLLLEDLINKTNEEKKNEEKTASSTD